MWQFKDSVASQIQSTQPKDHIHQNILFQLLFTYKRLLEGVLLVFEGNLPGFSNYHFFFQYCLPIILYQLSYSPGVKGIKGFTIQQKKDGILHNLLRPLRYKS